MSNLDFLEGIKGIPKGGGRKIPGSDNVMEEIE